jgi:aprataxin
MKNLREIEDEDDTSLKKQKANDTMFSSSSSSISKTKELSLLKQNYINEILPLSYQRPSKEDGAPINFSNFVNVLYNYIDDIKKYPKCIFMETKNCLVIYDLFPKAKIHLLVVPKREFLNCNKIQDITKDMKDQIIEMNLIANEISKSDVIQKICKQSNGYRNRDNYIKCGFHAIPSLHPLHLHIVSTDYNSDQLKVKYIYYLLINIIYYD